MVAWNARANEIFLQAAEATNPDARRTLVDSACGDDAELRRQVEALLKAHDDAGSFLNHPAADTPDAAATRTHAPEPGPTGETRTEPGLGAAGEPPLGFLTPPRREGHLGRFKHYEVQSVVGSGGMGVVLKAFDEKLDRVVAIKVLHSQYAANGTARRRFVREAKAVAAVAHDHVVTVHDVGEESDAVPYLVMQYVSGQSLQERLDRVGPLELKEILRIARQTANGLAAAHAQGLVHRDIKPANILLENGIERVKLTDFGLARAVDDASVTQSGVIAGTPQYMSPEQAGGEAVDHRSDLFSLGSVLYAMCTGHPPFRATGTMAVMKRVVEDTPRPVRETNPEIPDWLEAIIAKLHSKKPEDRFQSAQEVAQLLEQHLAHLQQPSKVPQLVPVPGSRPAATEVAALDPYRRPIPRWLMWYVAIALLLVFVAPCILPFRLVRADVILNVSLGLALSIIGLTVVKILLTFLSLLRVVPARQALPGRDIVIYFLMLSAMLLVWSLFPRGEFYREPRGGTSSTDDNGQRPEIEIKELPTDSELRLVKLRSFTPGKDKLPVRPRGPASAVTAVGDAWRIENTTNTGNFNVLVGQVFDGIPKDGVLVLRAKVKVAAKDDLAWGSLDFGGANQVFIGWDQWPAALSRYDRHDSEWTEKEVRHPAAEFFKTDPPAIHLYAGLHANGVLWLKDVELLHLPPQKAVSDLGFEPMFNGRDLAGWNQGNQGGWSVREGILYGAGNGLPVRELTSTRAVQNFHLRVEAKINDGGYAQIDFQGENHDWPISVPINSTSRHPPHKRTGIIEYIDRLNVDSETAGQDARVSPDTWFTLEWIVNGTSVSLQVNGKRTAEYSGGLRRTSKGFITLMMTGDLNTSVEFRKIEIKELPAGSPLDGRWVLDAVYEKGRSVPAEEWKGSYPSELLFKGDQYGLLWGEKRHEGSVRIDPDKNPAEIDFSGSVFEGLKPRKAIYEWTGNRLLLCLAFVGPNADPPRPTSFKTHPQSKNVMLAYRRAEDQPARPREK